MDPRATSPQPPDLSRAGSEPVSEVGARPLIEDDKLGWSTGINALQHRPGGSTRVGTNLGDYKIKSNNGWIILLILMALAVAAGVVIAAQTEEVPVAKP